MSTVARTAVIPLQGPKDLYEIGEIPPLGHVPAKMYAWAIRKERHGPPEQSMQLEVLPTWPIGEDEVLVFVMAGGVNYNGVWAGLGIPISPLDGHKNPYHIAGSDASGIVWAVGKKVRRWKVGDAVIVHCNQDDGDDEDCNGGDPLLSPSQRIWGYETPDGSFAQFCRVQSRQLMQKPAHLTWEEAACYTLTLATAYRMLYGHSPHTLKPGDYVLVWGASGGLGVFGVQLVAASGANAIGIVSDESKRDYVMQLGAKGVINRKDFNCWGQMPKVGTPEYNEWVKGGAQVRQGDLGYHRQARCRHRVRASGRGDVPGLMPGGEARRHGGVLRRHVGLQHHLRRPLCLDAAEAHPGLALCAPEAGIVRQPVCARPAHRPVHERSVSVGEDSVRARTDAHQPPSPRQYVGAGQRAAHGLADVRRRGRGGSRRAARLNAVPAELIALVRIAQSPFVPAEAGTIQSHTSSACDSGFRFRGKNREWGICGKSPHWRDGDLERAAAYSESTGAPVFCSREGALVRGFRAVVSALRCRVIAELSSPP